jgi:hypothetical protein
VKQCAVDALAFITSPTNWGPSAPITYLGRSLGGGVTAWLAQARPKPKAIIQQSTFASLKDTGAYSACVCVRACRDGWH